MKARFASTCSECGDKIVPGKEILQNSDDNWVHKHCVDDEAALP